MDASNHNLIAWAWLKSRTPPSCLAKSVESDKDLIMKNFFSNHIVKTTDMPKFDPKYYPDDLKQIDLYSQYGRHRDPNDDEDLQRILDTYDSDNPKDEPEMLSKLATKYKLQGGKRRSKKKTSRKSRRRTSRKRRKTRRWACSDLASGIISPTITKKNIGAFVWGVSTSKLKSSSTKTTYPSGLVRALT